MRKKSSFKLKNISDSDILSNLNITYTNNVNQEIVYLWNKYQIYLLDLQDPEREASELLFPFDILVQVLASYVNLICRTQSGDVWITKMKYNNLPLTGITPTFVKIEENIISLAYSEHGKVLFFLKIMSKTCNLLIYNSNTLKGLNNFDIKINNSTVYNKTNYVKCKMFCHSINDKKTIVIITCDGFSLLYFFIDWSFASSNCKIAKELINCPTEINDINFVNNNILISLSIGTIIKVDLDTLEHTKPEQQIIHLNTAIHKILAVKDYLIYTDGQTMWRADNIFNKEDICYRQIFVKLVKDFVYYKQNEILCTTYMNTLYNFTLDDDTAYINPVSTKEYCTAKQLIDNVSYMHNIVKEIEENDEMTKKIKIEENLITIIALANRQDIVDDIIHIEMAVHENYEDIVQNYKLITLTNDIKDYYVLDSYYLLIKLTVTPVHPKFTDILSDLFGKLEIHITLLSDNKVFKMVTLKVIKQLNSMNIVVPLTYLKNTKITVCIKLVINIPGALDRKQTLWISLYTNETVLSSEHFIKTTLPSANICHLKKTPETISNIICESASKKYGNLFKFSKKNKTNSVKWQSYVKLPDHYKELFGNEHFYKYLNSNQKKLLISVMSVENFLKHGHCVSLSVGNEKVEIEIDIGFSKPVLKIACVNLQIASDIRTFISNLLVEHVHINSKEEFISVSILNTLEDLQNDVKALLQESSEKLPEFYEKLQKNVIIALNI